MMPAWGGILSERELGDVVAYIKTFSPQFGEAGPGAPISIPPEPPVTPESIAEGKSVYIIMQCWSCHGPRGKGDGESAKTLRDDWGHRIKPFDFTKGQYKGGKDSESIYRTFTTGLNGTPMPAYSEAMLFGQIGSQNLDTYRRVFSDEEIQALQAYLATQPSDDELAEMSDEALEELADRRRWALVHFVQSLSKKPGLFHRLFVKDTELTD